MYEMGKLCKYLNCQRLGSSTFHGYCNEAHYKRAQEKSLDDLDFDWLDEANTIMNACEKLNTGSEDFDWLSESTAIVEKCKKFKEEIEKIAEKEDLDFEWIDEAISVLETCKKLKKGTQSETHSQQNSELQHQ